MTPRRRHYITLAVCLLAVAYQARAGGWLPMVGGVGVGELRVLELVNAESELTKAYRDWEVVLNSTRVREWCNSNCVKDKTKDGTKAALRKLDFEAVEVEDLDAWKSLLTKGQADSERAGRSTPWLILTNGHATFSGPLPKTEDALLTILKRYRGA